MKKALAFMGGIALAATLFIPGTTAPAGSDVAYMVRDGLDPMSVAYMVRDTPAYDVAYMVRDTPAYDVAYMVRDTPALDFAYMVRDTPAYDVAYMVRDTPALGEYAYMVRDGAVAANDKDKKDKDKVVLGKKVVLG